MGAGASSKKTQSNGIQNDFSRLRVHKRGIRVTEAYDSDADDEFGYDAAHILSNEGLEEALEARRGMMEGGVEKAATQLSQLHPHTTTGKHLVAENGRQWGDPEPGIPDLALDFIYGYRCGESSRQTMAYTSTGDICYLTGGTFVTYIHAGGGGSDEEEEAYADEDVPHRQCAFLEAADCNNDFICMAMHHEGHIAAVGEYGPNAAVYVFNVYTMQILAKLTKNIPNEGIAALSFSADGELLAVVGLDQRATLLVFEWEKARMVARESSLKARQDVQQKVYAMRFCSSPENNNRLWTCATQETKFWDVDQQDDELVGSVLQYGMEDVVQTALCVTFDIHGDAITGTKSGDIYFYRKNRLHKVERGIHKGPCTCVEASDRPKDVGGPLLFTAGKDGVIQEWMMKEDSYNYLKEVDWRPARRFEPNDINSIRSLALHCTDGILGFGTKAGSMHEFRFGDTNGGTDRQEAESAQEALDETYVRLLEPLYGKLPDASQHSTSAKAAGGVCIALHPSKSVLATGDNTSVRLWDMLKRDLIQTVDIMGGSMIVCLEYDPSATRLAIGLENGMVMVYDTESWTPKSVLKDRASRITTCKFSPNDLLLAVGSAEGIIDVYDVEHSLNRVNICQPSQSQGAGRQSQGHGYPVAHIDWSIDSARIKTQCDGMEILFWEVGLFRGGSGQALNATMVADTDWIDWSAPIGWHTTGIMKQIEEIGHVVACSRSHTGKRTWIVVGEYRGTLTIFPFPCRDGIPYEVSELTHCTKRLTDVKISFDDTFLVTASVDGVFQWRLLNDSKGQDEEGGVDDVEPFEMDRKQAVAEANAAWGTEQGIDPRLLSSEFRE